MRQLLTLGGIILLSGCAAATQPPAVVSWQYGTGNGDGVAYPGPAPTYARAYGMGAGDGVQSGQTAQSQYSYGAESQSGTMIQLVPKPPTVVAAPSGTSAGTHI